MTRKSTEKGARARARRNGDAMKGAIRVAYADPPYPGCARLYSRPGTPEYHPDAGRWDDPQAHVALMSELERDYPDGWALSTTSVALRELYPASPDGTRVGAWCRPGAPVAIVGQPADPGDRMWAATSFMWEAVLYRTPLLVRDGMLPVPDWVEAQHGKNQNTQRWLGAKPRGFCRWLFRLLRLGAHPDDVLVDLFPGSGAVTRAWDDYRAARVRRGGVAQLALFEGRP